MITLQIDAPFASCRKSFARSFAETYIIPPPATIYGLLLSLVGERFRRRHEGVSLAFAYRRIPQIATTVRKLSRYKYGVAAKQSKVGNAPDYIETLCDIEMLCWIDSTHELPNSDGSLEEERRSLETRVVEAIRFPERVNRYGVLCLGLSDDAVNDVQLRSTVNGKWLPLHPSETGNIELPIWVDHVGGIGTSWHRYVLQPDSIEVYGDAPPSEFTRIERPKGST